MGSIGPEKFLEQEIRGWCLQNGIFVRVFDSKAKFTEKGFYRAQGLPVGCPDLIGWNKQGTAILIELKAPKAPLVPSLDQAHYLQDAMSCGCFAVIVNSVDLLSGIYSTWLKLDDLNKIFYLKSVFPKKVKVSGKIVSFDL